MKDFINLLNRLVGGTYDAVSTNQKCSSEYTEKPQSRASKLKEKIQRTRRRAFTGMVLSIIAILTGVFIITVQPYDLIYKYKSLFGEGGEIFELWRIPPVDLYLRVFLWNVTNKEEYMNGIDEKIKIEEVGPYVYKELLVHDNITFNDNGTLTAIPRHPLVWVPELSEGRREDDILILPNIALLSIAHVVSDESYFTRLGLNMLVRQTAQEPLVAMTAKEFMFGYPSTLMTLGNKFLPGWIYFDKLGLIDRMYEFEGDFETIYTGENDITKAGLFDTYHGSTKIPQWDNPCGNIQGASDATKFPSYIQPEDKLLFFRKSMCRSKYLIHVNDTEIDGFNAYVYEFEKDNDDNGKYNKENACFCRNPNKCLPPGLLDVQGCYYGFPIALSQPHFYGADPILSANVEGSHPDPVKHTSQFVIEPKSGVPINLQASFQINLALKNIKTIANCAKFSEMVLPLLWAEFKLYGLPDSLTVKLKLYLQILPVAEKVLLYGSFVFGVVLSLYSIYKFTSSKRMENDSGKWIQDELHFIERQLSSYIPDKQSSMNAKELELYYDTLASPEIRLQEDSNNKLEEA